MTDETILSGIQKVYNDVMGSSDIVIKPETKLLRSGEISSFVLMELISAIEEEFDIELTYQAVKSMKTVGGLIRFIKNQH